jgi:uncharacterized membrane protein
VNSSIRRNLAAAITFGAMVATPLRPQGGRARRVLTTLVVSGLFATTTGNVGRRWGVVRTGLSAGSVLGATTALEHVASTTGRPFGRYQYTDVLEPRAFGVPVIVPMAWFAMAVPSREVVHAALGLRSSPLRRIVGGAAALTAWDLFLDPQMVGEGFWRWARVGRYRGIPFSNFLGWLAAGLVVMTMLEITLPTGEPDRSLVAEYSMMAVMETVGFAAFFRDRTVAVVGGVAMLPVAAAGLARVLGSRS